MLTKRSEEKELLDLGKDFYTPEEFVHCQKMLFRVNEIFGFFRSTVKLLKKLPKDSSLMDVGCGGGLFLLKLHQFFPCMLMRGVDISEEAIDIAKDELSSANATNVLFQLHAMPNFDFLNDKIDIIITTLMCHHLTNEQIIDFLKKANASARRAVIINDLHRHSIAHFFYRIMSPVLFRNRLITHDGLISIRRSFTYKDWKNLLKEAGITNYRLKWCFPFRWQVILWKK